MRHFLFLIALPRDLDCERLFFVRVRLEKALEHLGVHALAQLLTEVVLGVESLRF